MIVIPFATKWKGVDYNRLQQPGGCYYLRDTHALELAIQRLPLDAKDLSCAALIASGSREHLSDLLRLGIGQTLARILARFHRVDCAFDGSLINAAARRQNA